MCVNTYMYIIATDYVTICIDVHVYVGRLPYIDIHLCVKDSFKVFLDLNIGGVLSRDCVPTRLLKIHYKCF